MKQIALSKSAKDFLSTLDAKQFRQVVLRVFDLMAETKPQDSKQLVGYAYRRVDVGEYRIIYDFDAQSVRIVVIGKRNDDDVYRKLKRM